ncbi:MAG: hypothetical protein ABSE62_07820 [Chthoniobacteraceae bacterium]|jgi:hypothetical protein
MSPAIALPAALNRQFGLLERRLWRMDALVAACGGLGSLLLSYTLVFASDRLWDTPHWLRILFAICGWIGLAYFAWRYGSRWIWRRPSIGALAVIVQKRYRRLGDRLLGIVELADPHARPSNYSPELCRAAIAQVAGEASSFDFGEAAAGRESRRHLYGFLALVAVGAALAIAAPAASRNALLRWLWPAANIPRYTFATIEALPDSMVVAQGEPFDLAVALAPDSYWRPRNARAHFESQPSMDAPIQGGVAVFHFPGQTLERVLWISAGDAAHSIHIAPEIRPDLRQIRARLDLPSYLHYPTIKQTIDGGSLAFLPGTTATFIGDATRDLASATLQGGKPGRLAVRGAQFSTAPMLLELERNVTFAWRDALGLDGPAPIAIHLIPRDDDPPEVELRGLTAATAVLPEETIPMDFAATDDYGVRRLALSWQRGSDSPLVPPGPVHQIKVSDGEPQAKNLGGHYDFCPALLQIQPDTTILVRGLATDYYPEREDSSTPTYLIHVLSREAHARLVHDELEKLLEHLEDLTRRQEKILQSGQGVRAQKAPALASNDSAQRLGGQSHDERETAAQLHELAIQTANLLAEALRNPEIPQDTLKEWAGNAEEMNSIAANAMPSAAQSLDSSEADAAQRGPKLDQALAQEKQILDAMRQMQRQASDSLETLMAHTFAARLRRAAGTEQDIAASFQKMLPDTIGMTADQLPEDPRQQVASMTAQHAEVTREAGRLEDEISRLFDRTMLKRYGDVAGEMQGMNTGDALTALGGLVRKNIGVQSIETARHWSDQFQKWADRLDQKDNSRSAGGGSGTGQPDPAQLQALLELMRLRQQQEQLREQTSVLDEQKDTSADYAAGAQDAARQQTNLHDQLGSLAQDPTFPAPPGELNPGVKAMGDAAGLLAKPETGQPTYNAQTDAINLLDDAIAQQAQKAGQKAGALMAMMGMGGMGGAGGNGSGARGTTDNPNAQIPGSREGEAPEQHTVIQASGMDNSQLPGEFRDAIEGYDRAIEQTPPQ